MSVQIVSGAGATTLTVDTSSNAGRVTLYDSTGVELFPKPTTGSYLANIEIRNTNITSTTNGTFWAMRNVSSSNPTAYIRRIRGVISFDGTASAANGLRIGFFRFTTATPTSGTAITIIKKDTSYGSAAAITDIRQSSTILTMTSTVLDASPFAVFSIPAAVTSMVVPFNIDFMQENTFSRFRLKSGEGMCINYETVAAIVGMTVTGFVEWDEAAKNVAFNMSLSIISGAGSPIVTIDTSSNAARTTFYDSTGVELFPKPTIGGFFANIEVRATAANASGTTFWSMRNLETASTTAYIRRIRGTLSFDGAVTAATGLRIGFFRFINATPTGGSVIIPIRKDTTTNMPTAIADIRQSTGTTLTMTGTVLDASPFEVVAIPASVSSMVVPFAIDFQQENTYSPGRLKSGEGMCINYEVAAIIGMTVCGYVEFDERQ